MLFKGSSAFYAALGQKRSPYHHEASFCVVKMQAFRHRVESLRERCWIPLVGYPASEAGRLGPPQA